MKPFHHVIQEVSVDCVHGKLNAMCDTGKST